MSGYVVKDVETFINSIRKTVYGGFGHEIQHDNELTQLMKKLENNQEEMQELDRTLPLEECYMIAKEYITRQKNKNTGEVRYTITEDGFEEFIFALNDRLVSNLLNSLVQKGLLEMAFDAEENDFIFWVPDDAR